MNFGRRRLPLDGLGALSVSNGRVDAPAPKPAKPRKLSHKEQRELDGLPAKIEALETEQGTLTAKLADPAFYKREPGAFSAVKGRLDTLEAELAAALARWEELETIRTAAG